MSFDFVLRLVGCYGIVGFEFWMRWITVGVCLLVSGVFALVLSVVWGFASGLCGFDVVVAAYLFVLVFND